MQHRTVLWMIPLATVIGLLVGLLVGARTVPPQVRPTVREPDQIAGGVFVIKVDPDISEGVNYSVRYSPDARPLEQWKAKQATFTFRSEASARRANDVLAAVMREEMSRSAKED